ncbi:hypothetical protein KP509_28G044900 [Ceratopteris richardii]|nr:hypothetical protein KP509_28G044900 [Ceratopteris richardii]
MRKEVGGRYEVLKEAVQELGGVTVEKAASEEAAKPMNVETSIQDISTADQQTSSAPQRTSEEKIKRKRKSLKKIEISSEESALTFYNQEEEHILTRKPTDSLKQGQKKKSSSKKEEVLVENKSLSLKVPKGIADIKPAEQTEGKSRKHLEEQVSTLAEGRSEDLSVVLGMDEADDDDDSDIAAPDYNPLESKGRSDMQSKARSDISKVDSVVDIEENVKREGVQMIKGGTEPKEDVRSEMTQKVTGSFRDSGQLVGDKAGKQMFSDGDFGPGNKPPLTTILRIVNLPPYVTPPHLRDICESIAKVKGVSFRRGRIADIQFDVDLKEIPGVLERLRRVSIGSITLKVYPALRFSCDNNASKVRVKDANQYKTVRNSLMAALEQRIRFLHLQIEDFRELHNLKEVAK